MRITIQTIDDKLDNFMNIVDLKFKTLDGQMDSLKNNHFAHLSDDVNSLKKEVIINSINIKWIKKIQWALVTLSVGTLVGIVVNTYLIIK